MNGLAELLKHFNSGDIIRPDTELPNSLDLFRALARLSGAHEIENGANSQQIENLIGQDEHYLFIMLDGFGMCFLEKMPETSFLRKHFIKELQALCPPTTAASLTSLATMKYPAEHAVPGWFVYLEEIEKISTILPFIERFSERPLEEFGMTADKVFPVQSIWTKVRHEPLTIIEESIVNSTYTRYSSADTERRGYKTISEAFNIARRNVQSAIYPSFTYMYLPQLDSACHDKGTQHESVYDLIEVLDNNIAAICDEIGSKAVIIITADHGLIDIPGSNGFILKEEDRILDYLICPPTVEARMPAFHVKTGMEKTFEEKFTERFGEYFILITPDEAEQLKLFGPGVLSPLMKRRLGSFIGISLKEATLNYRTHKDKRPALKAVHGGLSREEMMVPLIIV